MSTTNNLGGKFLEEFQAWRDNIIATQFPDIPKLSPDTLIVNNFLNISTFDANTKIDIVKEKSQKYFVDILNYYNNFSAIGTLNPDVQELLKDEKAAEFYKEYAQVWFLQTIYHTEGAAEYKSSIRCGTVENELDDLTLNSMLTKQTMMLYFIALKELVPQILPYIYHRATFNAKVRSTLFVDVTGAQAKAIQYISNLVATVDNSTELDQFKTLELKSKLDLLNPTYRLSNDVIGSMAYTALAFSLSNCFQSCAFTKAVYYQTTLKVLKRILKNPSNQFLGLVNTIVNTFGDVIKASQSITELFNKVSLQPKRTIKNLNMLTFITKSTVLLFKAATVDSTFDPIKPDPLFYKFLNGLLCACQIGTIAYGLYNHEDMKNFNVSKLYAGRALYIHEYIDAVNANRVYIRMGEFIRDITKTMSPESVVKAFQTLVPIVVEDSSRTLISKIIPTLYIVSEDYAALTSFGSSKVQKRGSFVIPLDELDSKFAKNVFIMMQKTSFSGPLALYLGGTLFGLSIRKYMKDNIVAIINMIQLVKKSNPDVPDQISTFIKSQPTSYRVDYDSDDSEQMDWAVLSDSLYESSNPDIKKGLDIL
ncbi:hypothetical protein DLAC_00003 [Tieghemostelium lacteum]|uniref:Uncharacterized protein n=1 Tax=Tieghemostelium lacteum TaxID=361077 RepID=A0A152A8P4_TIELA|nr:hypothetical protein DLAC_00003 [Tieghemostelium lacteum]|eukprot:KYR02564.1 hypothetical protein DLAC_00003 [Tieghemostelium lacteum]